MFPFSGLGLVTVAACGFLWPPGGQVGLDSVLEGVLSFQEHNLSKIQQNRVGILTKFCQVKRKNIFIYIYLKREAVN